MKEFTGGDVLGIIHKALRESKDARINDVTRVQYAITPARNADSCNNAEVILTTDNGEKKQTFVISLLGVSETEVSE